MGWEILTHLRGWLHGSTAGACPPLGFHKAAARGANPSKGFLIDTLIQFFEGILRAGTVFEGKCIFGVLLVVQLIGR
jgi:hypothetical protein